MFVVQFKTALKHKIDPDILIHFEENTATGQFIEDFKHKLKISPGEEKLLKF